MFNPFCNTQDRFRVTDVRAAQFLTLGMRHFARADCATFHAHLTTSHADGTADIGSNKSPRQANGGTQPYTGCYANQVRRGGDPLRQYDHVQGYPESRQRRCLPRPRRYQQYCAGFG